MEQPLPPTQESVAALARHRTTQNSRATPRAMDRSYVREWNLYKEWVLLNRANNIIPAGAKFITTENVDLYFSESVAFHHVVIPATARRILCALQAFANDVEYIDGSQELDLESYSVKQALKSQSRRHDDHKGGQIEDPHSNLPTDVLSEADTLRVIAACINAPNWRDLCLSWTTCEQTFIRNHSMRQLTLADLRHNTTHGPSTDEDSIDSHMMSMIMQKGRHKERATKKRVVGAWRHKNYMKCSIGHLAMNFMCRFHSDADLNFFKHLNGADKGKCDWMKKPLIQGWRDENAVHNAYIAILRRVGVAWAKVTHMRKAGMEYASARGELGEKAVASMSKHQTDKISTAYVTELFGPTLRVMAGFPASDPV
jgi:hypothetical protein